MIMRIDQIYGLDPKNLIKADLNTSLRIFLMWLDELQFGVQKMTHFGNAKEVVAALMAIEHNLNTFEYFLEQT
jgi:hypothetical protein